MIKINTKWKIYVWVSSIIIAILSIAIIPTSIYTNFYHQIKPDYDTMLHNFEMYKDVVDEGFYEYVKNLPLPVKMMFFYDYVRTIHLTQMDLVDFMLAMVLHDVNIYNHFDMISTELQQIWISKNSMEEADLTMQKLSWWDTYWKNPNGSRYLLHTYIEQRIYYANDTEFTEYTNQTGDYCKSAVETAFTFQGDCEDISVLCCTLLEAAGYEAIIAGIHDPNYNNNGISLNHAFLWVKVNPAVNDGWTSYLWRFGNESYEWLLLDPTNFSYGENPLWIEHYDNLGYSNWSDYMKWRVIDKPGEPSLYLNNLNPNHE